MLGTDTQGFGSVRLARPWVCRVVGWGGQLRQWGLGSVYGSADGYASQRCSRIVGSRSTVGLEGRVGLVPVEAVGPRVGRGGLALGLKGWLLRPQVRVWATFIWGKASGRQGGSGL